MSNPFKSLQGETLKERFVIQDFLEKGGMSSIYLAWDKVDKRHVVVKTLPRELADQPKLVERMEREGKAIASLKHPNIIQIFDQFRLDDGRPAIVLDFMQGGSVRTLINEYNEKNRAMPIDYALSLMIPVVDAMSFVHSIQIIHRDLKPTNLLLHHNRRSAVVADLGIAKNLLESRITKTNAILGTPHYMSFEQATGAEVDARADIYAIGVMLYEMVTTRRPFQITNVANLLSSMQNQTPYRVTKLRPSASPLLEKIIHQCLQINREDRYQTMAQLRDDLQEAKEQQAEQSSQSSQTVGSTAADSFGADLAPSISPPPSQHQAQHQASNPFAQENAPEGSEITSVKPSAGADRSPISTTPPSGVRLGIVMGFFAAIVFIAFVALVLFLAGVF
jgi:serine/threonine protein kinase